MTQYRDMGRDGRDTVCEFTAAACLFASWWILAATVGCQSKVESMVAELQAENKQVCVRFERRQDGLYALLNPGISDEQSTAATRKLLLEEGSGLALESAESKVDPLPEAKWPALEITPTRHGSWNVQQLSFLKPPYRKRLSVVFRGWSEGGRYGYALFRGGLLKVDVDRGRIEGGIQLNDIQDAVLSSAGLVVLYTFSANKDGTLGTPWIQLRGLSRDDFRLLVLDPDTLRVRNSWAVRGRRIAGHPGSPIVYVSQFDLRRQGRSSSRLLVIDVERGRLIEAVEEETLRPAVEVLAQAELRGGPPRDYVALRPPVVSPDGRWLLVIPESNRGQQQEVTRLRIEGTRLHCEQRLQCAIDPETTATISSDSRYLCVPNSQQGPGCSLLQLDDFTKFVGSVAKEPRSGRQPRPTIGQFAAHGESKTAYVVTPQAKSGRLMDLRIVRGKQAAIVPLGARIYGLGFRPTRAGVLVTGESAHYWVEGGDSALQWAFESPNTLTDPNQLFTAVDPGIAPVVLDNPAVFEPDFKRGIRVNYTARQACWSPQGDAFFATTEWGVARFDDQTQRQTSTLSFDERVGDAFPTASGLVVSTDKETLTLLDFKTLAPVWQFDGLTHAAGHPAHDLVVGFQKGAIVVIDARQQKFLAQATADKLDHQLKPPPRSPLDVRRLAIFADGRRILMLSHRLAVLRIDGSGIEVDELLYAPQPQAIQQMTRLVVRPDGTQCSLGPLQQDFDPRTRRIDHYHDSIDVAYGHMGQAFRLTASKKTCTLAVTNAAGQVTSIALQAENRSLVRRATRVAPHPRDSGRYLAFGDRYMYLDSLPDQ